MGQQADDALQLAAEIRAEIRKVLKRTGLSKNDAETVHILSQALVNVVETAAKSDGIPKLDAG